MEFNLKGPSFTVSTACASSNHAIGLAFQMVRSGMVDVMIAGGSEAMLTFGGVKAWEGLRVMSKDACRPFSDNRSGMVQGEGAGIFILEKYENAISRGANVLAEIVGFAMNSDASDIVVPSQHGASTAMIRALKDARMDINDVGYINAHGTGTRANDTTECAAITKVFGAHVKKLMVSSTKSMHGHLIGGTGAVELLACIMAIRDGIIAPTIGYEQKDTSCDIDVVPNIARNAKVKGVVSNAFAFGGMNAVLVMRPV
jgi:nodulation protein E|tara:strand:- start:581 stop:1351 length:771 start_codon:yes stop_codon:yes gene_type:complete